MFKFIVLVIAFAGFLILLFGVSVFSLIFNALFGGKKKRESEKRPQQNSYQPSQTPKNKKVITPEEGEYIDFEEIKD